MKRKKILALTLAAAMSLALFSGCSRPSASSGGNDNPSANNTGSTSSEEPIVIKIGHTDSDTRSTHKWSVWLGEWLEEQAPGRFKVEVYPNGQLGDSPDMVAGVKLGTLTMEFDLSSVVSSVSGPATSAVDLPYLYPTYEDWVQGTFENGGLELFNETLAPSGYYCVGMFYNGMRQVISRTSTYHNSEDLHGQKIRVAQNDLDIKTWDAMGGSPRKVNSGIIGGHKYRPMFSQLLLQPVNIFVTGDFLPPESIFFNPFRFNVLLPKQFL